MIARHLSRLALPLAMACGSPAEPAETGGRGAPPGAAHTAAGVPSLASSLVAKVPAGTFGPYVGRGASGSIVVWAARAGSSRKWYALELSESGAAIGKPRAVADAPAEVGLVAVEPAGKRGFVVASTRTAGETHHVEALFTDAKGGPVALDEGTDPVRWIDAIATASGTLVLWARQRGGAAELEAVSLDATGKRGETRRVAGAVRAWQALPTGAGAALAVVGADAVRLVRLDATGRTVGETVVAESKTAELDLDAVALGDRVAVAWSDRRELDARIQLAIVDAAGKLVVTPRSAIESVDGDQALVRLVPPLEGGPAFLVWEVLPSPRESERTFRIASVSSEGKLGADRGEIRVSANDETVPELAATARGVAALTLARACRKSDSADACAQAERLPTFIELDRRFQPVASEPMRLEALSGNPAELAWGLGCTTRGCLALAAVASDPAPVYAVQLATRSPSWKPAVGPLARERPPRPRSVTTLSAADPLADVAASRLDGTTLVAWVTHFDPTTPWKRLTKPAPDGRFEPLQALLQVRALPDGKDASAVETVSLRARSLGGVALAPGAAEHKEALLVWTAIDNGQPQVFATIVGPDGKKLRQKMVTQSKGEKSDVAVAFASDGWLLAWVDERHGDAEIYSAKFNRFFQRVGPERRLTNAAGAATGIAMSSSGDRVLVAWADARDSEQPGSADPYALWLKAQDGSPIGTEQRLASSRAHSFSPVLARLGASTVVAWLEADGGGIRVARLDDAGKLGTPTSIATAGAPTALTLACATDRCRVVAAIDRGEHGELVTAEWAPSGSTPSAARIAGLPGPAGQAASPALIGDDVFFADQVRDRGRVRRMTVEWR